MHIYAHDINLDNIPQSDIKKLRYVSFLNMTIQELEILEMFANSRPIPQELSATALNLQSDINNIVAESIKAISEESKE